MKITFYLASVLLICTACVAQDLCRSDVQTELAQLRQLSGTGTKDERATVVQDDGTLRHFTGTRDRATVTVDIHSVAILHNHPWKITEPSAADLKTAHDTKVPVYVVTRQGIWVALPDGTKHPAGTFKTLDAYTADPEGAPLYGREHPFTVTDVLEQCIPTRLSATVFLKRAR